MELKLSSSLGHLYCSYFLDSPGPAVCFFGGFASPSSAGTKSSYLLSLAKHSSAFRFVIFDYLGHGMSDGASYKDFCISEWYTNCIDVLNYFFKNEQIIIVGSSMGGWLGLLLAKRNPEKVLSFLGLAVAPDFVLDIEKTTEGPFPRNHSDGEYTYIISEKLINDGKNNLILNNEKIEINCPVTLIHGMLDTSVNYNKSILVAEKMIPTKTKVVLLKGADHGLSDKESLDIISMELMNLVSLSQDSNHSIKPRVEF